MDAKNFNSRTIDALEFANQYPLYLKISNAANYIRMAQWIDKQIKKAEK